MELVDIKLKELIEKETGEKFDKQGYIKCPFHSEKTPSLNVKFLSDANKERFLCYGCEATGDAIDFIMKFRNMNYIEARKYLGLEVKKTEKEMQEEKIKGYIDWELSKFRKGQKLLGIFKFTNEHNKVAYFKAKFRLPDGTKKLAYYHLEEDKVVSNRGGEELPYNLYNTLEAIKDNYVIIIVEGEKDANTINSIFKNKDYVATSIKGCKDISIILQKYTRVYVIGDTGQAGEQYKFKVYSLYKEFAKEFKFINLPGIKEMGDNKDVTDWLECGHNKNDLLRAFDRSLDLKNKYELQQNKVGIYKTIIKEKSDGTEEYKKYLTDFRVREATRINFVDEEVEGVKLILESPTGQILERTGPSVVFDDTKAFKNFLGTLDLGFKGKSDDLTDLKSWINKYFALENEEIHSGIKFIEINEQIIFVENEGAILPDTTVTKRIKSDKRNNVEVISVEPITKEELRELRNNLFKFASPDKSISIVGTIINNLAVYQAKELKVKLHHLLIVGESGSGKSTILENVVAAILNYPKKDIKSIGLISPFALTKSLSDGNYSMLFDEFKPSSLDRYRVLNLSETLRNLYDRATISKGNKSLKTKDFQLNRPVIIAGEESYPNQEKALIERSCIVYLSKREREEKHTKAMKWLIENEEILNKLGRSLIELIISMSVEDYKKLREESEKKIEGLENRVLSTAINMCTGIGILNKLFKSYELKEIKDYNIHIINNLKNEVLDSNGDTYSIVERMLLLYNEMIEDGRALQVDDVVRHRGDGIFIKTSEMLNQIHEHVNRVGADLIPLKLKDFRKQAKKSGYLVGMSDKLIKIDQKPVRFDTYNENLLRALKVDSIVPPEFTEVEGADKVIPFKIGNNKN